MGVREVVRGSNWARSPAAAGRSAPTRPTQHVVSDPLARSIRGSSPERVAEAVHALHERLRPEVQELLAARPVSDIDLDASFGGYLGLCVSRSATGTVLSVDSAATTRLHDARSDRRGIDGWHPQPGTPYAAKPGGVSFFAATAAEKRELVLVHEVGHAVHNMGMYEAGPIMRAAYARSRAEGSGVTQYARANHCEYFAESFALYNHSPEKLRHADPVGHDMVRDVVAALRREVLGRP